MSLLVAGAMAFPVGAWIDRHGPRLLMTVGSITASILVIAWSQVTDKTTFYLIWTGLGASAATVLYEPAFAVIVQWFRQRRGTALAVITFAAGLASTIFLPLSDALLHAFGWCTAVHLLGIFLATITIPLHVLMLHRRPDEPSLLAGEPAKQPADKLAPRRDVPFRKAVQSRVFWLLTLGFGLAGLVAAAIRVHFIPFLISAGIDSSTAAFATGTIGIMQVTGRIIFAPLERRWSSTVIVIGIFALQAAAMAILLIGQAPWMIGLFIVIFGASQGATTLASPSILAELYSSAHYGRVSSIMAIFPTLAMTSAPLGASLSDSRIWQAHDKIMFSRRQARVSHLYRQTGLKLRQGLIQQGNDVCLWILHRCEHYGKTYSQCCSNESPYRKIVGCPPSPLGDDFAQKAHRATQLIGTHDARNRQREHNTFA